jgi:NAD(P)-dependent dehydrogenase (short-subunit alcohol dehydrogenase family)
MAANKPVAVVIGATSKWQADGRNTLLAHGAPVDDEHVPVGRRWGIGGAVAQKFAAEGCSVVLTTRSAANAKGLEEAIRAQGGDCLTVELDLVSEASVAAAFRHIRASAGDPSIVVYNAGYLEGRDLPPEMELLEHLPVELFDTAMHIAARGPFLVAKEVLPAMRAAGQGTFLITNNPSSLRGRKRYTGQSLYYPRVMMRALAQSAHRGVLRARRPRRQRDRRRPDRLARHACVAPGAAAARGRHGPGEDRRRLLVPAHPGPLGLDP